MKQFIICLLCGCIVSGAFAQGERPVKAWSVGTAKGYAHITGEVRPASGFGFGLYADRSFTRFLSARLVLGMGEARGLDRTTSTNWLNHPVWNGTVDPAINYNNANSNVIYANYKTAYKEASLQAVFTFTQLPFLNNSSPFDGFLLAGAGAMRYTARVDAADANGFIYDFAAIEALPASSTAETIANLNTAADGNYETPGSRGAQITPLYQLGAGVKWSLRPNLALSLTHRVSLTGTDELDAYQWGPNNTMNGTNDIHHFSTLGLSYTFHKKAGPKSLENLNPPPPPEPAPKPEPAPAPEIVEAPEPVAEPEPPVDIVELTSDEKEVVDRAFENTEFETDKAVIRPRSFEPLNELASLLSEHPRWKLRITGHTDNTGTAEWNMDLSRRRAESVRDYLANRGIDTSRFILAWYGEEQPIADNATPEGRQRNRRVAYEIVE